MYDEHFEAGIRRIRDILDRVGLTYHSTGDVAASFYGGPTFTQDVDLVIHLTAYLPETEPLLRQRSSR